MKKIKGIAAGLITLITVSSGITAFSVTDNKQGGGNIVPSQPSVQQKQEKLKIEFPKIKAIENKAQIVNPTKSAINISDVVITSEMESRIKAMDSKNASRNITRYKYFIKEMNPAKSYRSTVESTLMKNKSFQDVLIAYNFLFEQYGLISELEGLLKQRSSADNWSEVFEAYNKSTPQYVPKDFKEGYLRSLFKDGTVTVDDVMMADRIAQKKKKTFEEVIALRKNSKSWKEIKSSFGIVNSEEKMNIVPIDSAQVEDLMKDVKLEKDTVIKYLAIAKKCNVDEASIKQVIKKSKSEEDVYRFSFEKKYEN